MNPFPNARWLFFDLGYTLLNEDDAWLDQMTQMVKVLHRLGIDSDLQCVRQAFVEAIASFAPKQFVAGVERLSDRPQVRAELLRYSGDPALCKPYPDSGCVLETLARRYSVGLIANQSAGTPQRIAKLGWDRYIKLCISSAEAGVTKPDPAIFRMALDQANCPPGQAVMIGDRLDNDIRPAKALGMGTVRVLQGLSACQIPRVPDETPDVTVDCLERLLCVFASS